MNDGDAALLDKLAEAGFDPAAVEGLDAEERQRLERLSGMLGLLDGYPAEPLDVSDRQTLVNATLARIDRYEGEQDERMKFSNTETSVGGSRFGASELVAVAAIIILGLAIIFPIMNASQRTATQQHASQNLAMIGQGLVDYASSHNDTLPGTPVDQYSPVFGEAPTRLDLQPVIDGEYFTSDASSNTNVASRAYSYQTQPAHHALRLNRPTPSILLGDSNPMVEHIIIFNLDKSKATLRIQSQTTISWSPNVLFSDGHSERLSSHLYEGDDLRLPSEDWESLTHPDAFLTH